ncbi:tetratricopeptide repeat protein [Haliangium sp.]|uniref:tetratricopeptide repeat protein n=1 Tax=Haliangium sp. TaxID=2663208 RepID=UPI003D0D2FD1
MADQAIRNEFDAAVDSVRKTPADLDSWDVIESLADDLECPDEVAALYREVMAQELPLELATTLGERAANFLEEWFGDDPAATEVVLLRVLEIDPDAEWAFQRLTVVFSTTERWDRMLALYDRSLEATADEDRQIHLLEEAAQVARDVANQPEKAITYLQRLVPLKPGDVQLESSLERLLERHERWADLIKLWEAQLDGQSVDEREQNRLRIARCWLNDLRDPGHALEAVRPLLAEAADDTAACELLERIVTDEDADAPVRASALDLLRVHYEGTERPREVVRVIEAAIAMASPEDSKALREEAGSRLAALEDDAAAMDHYAALLALDPALTDIQEKMDQLARRSGNFARYADGVAAAAEACADVPRKVTLLAEAARIRLDMLEDEQGAIGFYQAAMAQEGLPVEEELRVARRLAELLGRADRTRERLDVLERLSNIDPNPSSQRTVIGEAARLAESLGETDRALALWKLRIDADADDLFALDAMIGLLEGSERWQPLIDMLGIRVAKAGSPTQRRADLIRIASIYDRALDAPDQAIEAWLRVQSETGENAETVDALADLYSRTQRWEDQASLLERASGRETGRVTDRLVSLADTYRAHLGAPDRALSGYRNALAVDPTHAAARAGMTALLELDTCRDPAAEALAAAYRETGDWPRFLELLEPRLAGAQSDDDRLRILREAATIQEQRVGDVAAAASSLLRALPLTPKDRVLEAHMARLAGETGQWDAAAEAYEQAAQAVADDPFEAARLRFARGEILETRLDRPEDAYAAFYAVLAAQHGNRAAARAVVRLGTRLGRWEELSQGLLPHLCELDQLDHDLLEEMETVAAETAAWDGATAALRAAIDGSLGTPTGPSPRLAFGLYLTVARWHREARADEAAARDALAAALAFDAVPDRERAQALRELAAIERANPSLALFGTLRRLSELDAGDLDVFREVAEVGIEHGAGPDDLRGALSALLARATAAWRSGAGDAGQHPPEAQVEWALGRLVDLELAQNRATEAVDLLIDSARLPFGPATRRDLRVRAATIAADVLGDDGVAIQMYQAVLSQAPEDMEVIDKLAALYEKQGRVAEKLSLRQHQLTLEGDPERRIELRLEIAGLVGHIEEHGGRLTALEKNLDDRPGHRASIEALCALLDGKRDHAHLCEVLERQAGRVHSDGDPAAAAELWARAAEIAESKLEQVDRAIQDYRHVVDISAQPDALRALARLYMERNQPAQAVPWFENLLAGSEGEARQGIVLQLARAHLGAKHHDRAVACLENNISDQEPALEARTMLAELYRSGEAWEPLARLLTRSLPLLPDTDTAIAYAREAADIYSNQLESPDRAIPALEKALSVVEGDRTLRTQLAVGLRTAGRLDESSALLNELIEEFGRRRSPERAALHVEMARVEQAQGKGDDALKQMELASKMDVGNIRIQKELAEMSRQAGKLAKAERTYRSLLLVVRRNPPGEDISAVGPSEVLFELHKLAAEQGQDEQAKELLETAVSTAVQSDAEVRRLRRTLLVHGEADTLLRVLEQRLDSSDEGPAQAVLLADKAEVLDKQLGRPDEALAAILEALQRDPARDELHATARSMAQRAGASRKYVDVVVAIADSLRRKEDPPLVARQLIRAGEALEQDVGDAAGALALYQRVEALGERTAEAYFAIARVAGALGKTDEQARVLEAMLALATAEEPSSAQIDALYRLAEIFIAGADRREQGIELLEKAFAAEPRYAQAGASLRTAAAAAPDDDRVMALYERVARTSNDWEMLLDFLERRAQRADATPTQVREAVDVALAHDQAQRAEALLGRAVEAARTSDEGFGGAVWAVMGLIETRVATGELASARDLVYEVGEYADPAELDRRALDIAGRAASSDQALAAEMYEFVRERNPSARHVWEPLIQLYRDMGDGDRLQAVVSVTLPTLVEPSERNALRIQHARYFIEKLGRHADAVDVLRDALLDDPDHAEAGALLEEVLREQGDHDALVDFLWQRFEDAKERNNPETVTSAAMRLGALLDERNPDEAVSVYRSALEVAPDSLALVRIVLDRLGPDADPGDRAELMERLIELEEPARAVAVTLELVELFQQTGDEYGVQRVLERGYRANPDDDGLRARLEAWYRDREAWIPLAELMSVDAQRLAERGDHAAAVARFREAAALQRDTLGDPGAAAGILRQARALAPSNHDLVAELAACLTAAGDLATATAAIGEALDQTQVSDGDGDGEAAAIITGGARVDLLLLRSDLRLQLGEEEPAIRDLEEAYVIDAERIRPQLIEAVDRRRSTAAQTGDIDAEREAVMRLSALLGEAGDTERTRELLMGWVERQPQDREPLYSLLAMDKSSENWAGVLAVCARLVNLEQGEAQIEAALGLAEAAEKAEQPAEALPGLEAVHAAQPNNGEIRDRLRRIYELSGAFDKLATVLLADGDHAEDPAVRCAAYRRAAEIILFNLGSPESAIEPARKAREIAPDDHDATLMYVDVLTMSGQTDEVIALLQEAIGQHKRRSPQLAALKQRMARVAAVIGDRDGQLSWLKESFDVDRKNPEIAAELAQLATEMGDYDLALKPLRAITLMEDPRPITRVMAFLWEAKIEHARGNQAKAELWARKALREDPNYPDAQAFLDEISK